MNESLTFMRKNAPANDRTAFQSFHLMKINIQLQNIVTIIIYSLTHVI